ncbi:MAG: response regulator transcription factor [Candidatus Eremiobacterota bacterium]
MPFNRPIRVLIADDHAVVRAGLRMLLESRGIQVVAEAAEGEQAVALAERHRPDVVLLDLTMPPGQDGIWAAEQLRRRLPEARLLILTMHDDEALRARVFEAGAHGYVLKQAADADLAAAIRELCGQTSPPATPLTERENEVLQLIAQGYGNKEIANHLQISVKTVETHKAHGMQKLGLQTRAEVVRYALKAGMLTPG